MSDGVIFLCTCGTSCVRVSVPRSVHWLYAKGASRCVEQSLPPHTRRCKVPLIDAQSYLEVAVPGFAVMPRCSVVFVTHAEIYKPQDWQK